MADSVARIDRDPGCRCDRPLPTQDEDGDLSCLHCGHDLGEMHHPDDKATPGEWGPLGLGA